MLSSIAISSSLTAPLRWTVTVGKIVCKFLKLQSMVSPFLVHQISFLGRLSICFLANSAGGGSFFASKDNIKSEAVKNIIAKKDLGTSTVHTLIIFSVLKNIKKNHVESADSKCHAACG